MLSVLSNRTPVIILTGVFIFSRILIKYIGVEFYGSFVHRMWQTLDVDLLRTNLVESIFYMHMQPPLYNILIGLVVKIFPSHYYFVFQVLNMALTFGTAILLWAALRKLGVRNALSLSVAIFFLVNPAVMLYENLNSYTTLTVFLVTALGYSLVQHLIFPNRYSFVQVSVTALALVMTRSSFHLIWLVLLLWLTCPKYNRKALVIAVISVGIATAWYLKNYFIFDSFHASSWLGMSLARVVPPSTALGKVGPFRELREYDGMTWADNPCPEVDVLTQSRKQRTGYPNFNHYQYLEISERLQSEVASEITSDPTMYISAVSRSFIIYFNPATHAPFVAKNNKRMMFYSRWVSFNFLPPGNYTRNTYTITAAFPAILFHIAAIGLLIQCWRGGRFFGREKKVMIALSVILAYGMLVGNLLEAGENNRFRFETHTILLMLVILCIDRFFKNFRNSYNEKHSM